ncbi:MAG: carbohydrate ABC transporter permease [Clostridia bacterium]|nr:carbohydrate ABC transporter permease [Clostridia bacterium]MBP3583013.1 carbohydrate ABC transporter permease [Clostridia bacterium]
MDSTKPVITKESKNRISVDYEGKLSFKERLMKKIQSSHTWIKVVVSVLKFILMLGVSYVILFPFFSKIAGSFMARQDVVDATVSLIPKNWSLATYTAIMVDNKYWLAFLNTLLLSLLCALIQTFVACLIGYGISKFKFKGNKLIMAVVIVTMIIPHSTLEYAMLQRFTSFDIAHVMSTQQPGILELLLGWIPGWKGIELINTFWPFLILSIGGIGFKNGLYIYMMRQFFKGVPDELEESAYVDGSGTFRTFLQIILPLSVPMMITIFLFAFSWQWTDQFYTQLFYRGSDSMKIWSMVDVVRIPSSLVDKNFAGRAIYDNVIKNTAGIMIVAPLIIMYLFCQKYLVQGIERSGLVG